MDDKTIKKIAHEIATHLFTNGRGEKAMRLQLEMENGKDGGGWSEYAVEVAIRKILEKANEQ